MSTTLLRQAADRLDALAAAADASPGPDQGPWYAPDALSSRRLMSHQDSAYIAAMSPSVGKALAAWLRDEAETWEYQQQFHQPPESPSDEALAVARAILGGTP